VTRKTASADRAASVAAEIRTLAPEVAVVRFHLRAADWRGVAAATSPAPQGDVVAVCAIAEPQAFLANARSAGAGIREALVFPDHWEYTAADVARIAGTAAGSGIVTTAKDWVKLAEELGDHEVWVLEQSVEVEAGGELLARALDRVLR
jgi:tetraacyldisaccharide 4'-kinase